MKQKGFTLVELLVALAVGSVLITGALLTFQQVVLGTGRANNQAIALADVSHAALQIKKDIQMVQSTNLIDEDPVPQSSVTLSWTDHTLFTSENSTSHSSMYTLSGTELLRTYDGTVSIVGRHITYIGFTQSGSVITCEITATCPRVPQRSKTLKFSMRMQPEAVE